jgi:hypothetical protein
MNTLSAPTTIRSNSYRDNIPQSIDPLELTSLSQSTLLPSHHLRLNGHLLESTVRQAARPWTKHSQRFLRLAQPKRIHTPPITSSRPLSRERPNNSLTWSARSTSTIPRYVVYQAFFPNKINNYTLIKSCLKSFNSLSEKLFFFSHSWIFIVYQGDQHT